MVYSIGRSTEKSSPILILSSLVSGQIASNLALRDGFTDKLWVVVIDGGSEVSATLNSKSKN